MQLDGVFALVSCDEEPQCVARPRDVQTNPSDSLGCVGKGLGTSSRS